MKEEKFVLKISVSTLAAVVVALSLVLGCEWAGTRAEDGQQAKQAKQAAIGGGVLAGPGVQPSPFVAVAEQVMPAVVSIDTKKRIESESAFEFEQPFGRLFRDLIPDFQPREYEVPSYASGFIFDQGGYVITNNHVVSNAEDITVRLMDETEYGAEVVGTDPNTDIAVLKIAAGGDLPVVRLGDSDSIRIGDWAIAIGNPFGRLEGTVTVGVISAKGRSALSIVGGTPALQDFIQTDASINFGNSGGPLVNINGEAVGMNTAINPLGQGIGFAIPINMIKRVADELMQHGKVSWGYLGILPQEIDKDLADALGVEVRSGILVGSVVDDSPADRGGLKRRDIIREFDGRPVSGDVDQFRLQVANAGTGKEVSIVVLRGGDRKRLKVQLGERPTEVAQAGGRKESTQWLGLRVDDVGGSQGRRVAPSDVETGVVVTGVEEGSPAYDAGLRAGDIIEEVNGEEVETVSDFEHLKEEAVKNEEKPVLLLIARDGTNRYVAVKPRKD
jgi:serine protease Do